MRRIIALLLVMLLPLSALAEELPVVIVQTAWPDGESITRTVSVPATAVSLEIDPDALICGVYPEEKARYILANEYSPSELGGFNVLSVTCAKYEGGTLLWRRDITDYRVKQAWEMSEGVLLWGMTDIRLEAYGVPKTHWISLLSHEGEVLWSQPMETWNKLDDLDAALDNGDGTWTLFFTSGTKWEQQLLVRWFSADGMEIGSCTTLMQELGLTESEQMTYCISWAAHYGEGYLLHIRGYTYDDADLSRILYIRPDGTVENILSYDGDESYYTWQDFCLIGDDLWISGYAVSEKSYQSMHRSFRAEINNILFYENASSVASDWLTPQLQENYTALLLRCDASTGDVLAAYTAPGCLGGTLTKEISGGVLWDVQRFVESYYSPSSNIFTISATMQVYRCGVDGKNGLRWVMDSGEQAGYVR